MHTRVLTFRYVGGLLVVAGLLIAEQTVIHQVLARQDGDARVINLAGRQRMLGQRLCALLLSLAAGVDESGRDHRGELARTADDWELTQAALREGRPDTGLYGGNSDVVRRLFAQIDADHRAMLTAARASIALTALASDRDAIGPARTACAHQEAFLAGMDRIVAEYEREARQRIAGLRRLELVLLALALLVLALDGAFVFRPAVHQLRLHLAERALVQDTLARLEHRLVQVNDREQLRLAQDLHDGLGQHLIGASFLLRPLRRQLGDGAGAAQLDEVGRLLAEAIDHTRDLVRSLHSPALEAAGLAAALGEIAAHTARVFGVACQVHDRAGIEPPMASCVHLLRIAREAAVNAAKHAGATRIDIELGGGDGELVLVVRDDGVGIAARPVPGMGLHLMECRARLLGAALHIAAQPGGGTAVTCRLPLDELAIARVPP